MVKSSRQPLNSRKREEDIECAEEDVECEEGGECAEEEIGECELAMCCAAGIVLLLAGSIVAIAVTPSHKLKIHPKTIFSANVKTVSSFDVKSYSSPIKDSLLSESVLASRVIDCTSFAGGKTERAAVDLLVLVHSNPDFTSETRNKVRMSWMMSTPSGVKVVFVIPAKGRSSATINELRRECKNYKDMVVFLDGPLLPESEFMLLQLAWASQGHMDFQYLLKTRDFMYVNLPKMMTDLIQELKRKKSNSYLGYFRGDMKTRDKKSKKHAEPNWILCDRYIRFAHSSGYILSRELVHRLHSQSTFLYPYNNEDIAMATWLSPYKDVDWHHDIRFNTEIGHNRGCRNNWLVFQSTNLVTHHQMLQDSGKICAQEWQETQTYSYNFEMPPSNCCTVVHFH